MVSQPVSGVQPRGGTVEAGGAVTLPRDTTEENADKDYVEKHKQSTATVLRLCGAYKGSGRVVYGDSWFE